MPDLEYLSVPESQRQVSKVFYESNFVQVIEGEIDTVHASILHSRLADLQNSDSAGTLAGSTPTRTALPASASWTRTVASSSVPSATPKRTLTTGASPAGSSPG